MAKRKSINKRLSRYNRSSIGSGFLDPNSEVLGEEEPFWWNNLTNNTNQSLAKNNSANQTSRYLDSDSQAELSNATSEWWNILETTDSEEPRNLQKNKQPVSRITKTAISESDEEDGPPPLQKRKITIRGKSKRSKSNPFLKAFIDSENSKSSKLIQETTVAQPTNDASISNVSSKISDSIEDHKSEKDNVNTTDSTDQSRITDKILKSKPRVFRKRYRTESNNIFEDLLKSTDDKHNETKATQILPISSDELRERSVVSKENLSNILKENISQMNTSLKNDSKHSVKNLEISNDGGNLIYHKHSDSSFEIQSDHIDEASQKESFAIENARNQTNNSAYTSKNNGRTPPEKLNVSVPRLKQKASINGGIPSKSLLMHQSDDLNKDNDVVRSEEMNINASTPKRKSNRSADIVSKSLIMHQTGDLNKDNDVVRSEAINSSASTSKQRSNSSTGILSKSLITHQTDNLNRDNFSNDNDIVRSEATNISASTSKQRFNNNTGILSKSLITHQTDNLNRNNFSNDNDLMRSETINISTSTATQRSNRNTGILSKSLITHQTGNFNKENFSKDDDTIQPEEINIIASTPNQQSNRNTRTLSKSLIKLQTDNLNSTNFPEVNNKSVSEEINIGASTSKQKSYKNTSVLSKSLIKDQTDNLNSAHFSRDNDTSQLNEINIGASTSKQKSNKTVNIPSESVTRLQTDDLNNEHYSKDKDKTLKELNMDPSTLKQKSKVKELIRKLEKIKGDGVIKKRLEKKKKVINLSKIPASTPLVEKEIREKIKELQNKKTKKQSIKPEIHRAYLVNGKPYKRPRLPRPQFWVTDRLYRHLWKVMEPKCKLLTRVESEKFIKRLSKSVSVIIKSKKYDDYKDELDDLMNTMAHLGIINTRNDFYDFSYEFLPYEFRIKVIPMIMPGNVRNVPYDPEKLHEPLLVK